MELLIKNIILYDQHQHVCGFVELKNRGRITGVKVRHNLEEAGLLLSVIADGEDSSVFIIDAVQSVFEIKRALNLDREIFVCVMRKVNDKLTTVASGVINPDKKNIFKRLEIAKDLHEECKLQDLNNKIKPDREAGKEAKIFIDLNEAEPDVNGKESQSAVAIKDDISDLYLSENAKVKEVDEILRAVCTIDENGKGICETCPYRDYFYQFTLDREKLTEVKDLVHDEVPKVSG